ncbi:MAG: AAA family ATPase [Treponema sp.]|nr:AAA family ATPase [Treponema sp.]
MLLKSIKLENFRQYKNASLDFAQDVNGKNVTIIIGENGSGKTTFLQSFFWCFYGNTHFKKDQSVLNLDVAKEMLPSQTAKVNVELKFQHGEIDYVFHRLQEFQKSYNDELKPKNSILEIRKIENGNTEWVKPSELETVRNSILREEVSKYFFFDGERIETMGQEIANGKKNQEFADAIKGLLGLSGMQKAIEHLNRGSKNSVIGSYNDSYDSTSDSEIKDQTYIVNECNDKLDEIKNEQDRLEKERQNAENIQKRKEDELLDYDSSKNLQEKKNELEKRKSSESKRKAEAEKNIFSEFNTQMNSLLTLKLIYDGINIVKNYDLIDSDIPNITDRTIQYLIDRKKCLCGNTICEDSNELKEIKKWFDILPPKSISNMINDFKNIAKNRVFSKNNFIEKRNEELETIEECNAAILDCQDEITKIDKILGSGDVEEKVHTIQNEIERCRKIISNNSDLREDLAAQKALLEKKKESAENRRKELSLKDQNNRQIEIYKAYAQQIYDSLKTEYDKKEKDVHDRLEKNINKIFTDINNGDLSLRVNDKYQIDVFANNVDAEVETSEGQSLSVIFAFITSMIKMARENSLAGNSADKQLSSEVYPLVMDAPLSKFDKKHIKNICENIPRLAEQVIIFIKDTDGDIAKEYLSEKIGKEHRFNKISETETELK